MKTLLITGGTGGLGSAVVPRLARDYHCLVTYRSPASFETLRKQVPAIEGLSDPAAIRSHAPLHGLVLLAGGFTPGSGPDAFRAMFEANVLSVASALESALPHLSDGGRIVAISSAASQSHPAGLAAYTASKAAVNATVMTLAGELSSRGITANALLPTALATAAMKGAMPSDQLVPLERVAEWIAFLLSEAGAGVTGQLIELRA